MSAHHVKHASACPAYNSRLLSECTCGAPGTSGKRGRADYKEPPPPADVTDAHLADIARMYERLVQRRIRIGRPADYIDDVEDAEYKPRTIRIVQRCSVCREDVIAFVDDQGTNLEIVGVLGDRVRIAYYAHRCPPVKQSLLGATYEDLEAIHESLESQGTEMVARAAEIDRIKKARAS